MKEQLLKQNIKKKIFQNKQKQSKTKEKKKVKAIEEHGKPLVKSSN